MAQVQEGPQVPYHINKSEFLSGYVIVKLLKTKKEVLEQYWDKDYM